MAFNLREQILLEHSRVQALRIADWVGNSALRFAQLIELFLLDEYRVVQRAAWIISLVAEKQKHLLVPHLEAMVHRMTEPGIPVAVKRNVVRILQNIEVPESLHGPVMNVCFDLLADINETVAVRAFSMTVLAQLARYYPEIKNELRAIIKEGLEREPTPGFRVRGQKILKSL